MHRSKGMIRVHRRLKRTLVMMITVGCLYGSATAEAVTVTSRYGWRTHPITEEWSFHTGIDLGYEYGTVIAAVMPGIVVYTDDNYGGYGKTVIVDHGNEQYTLYAHCSEIFVANGQAVDESMALIAVGSTGNSTGAHLHLELWRDGQYVDPMSLWD